MRLLILAHDALDPDAAKTANAILKYARDGWSGDEVVAVIDRKNAGRDAGEQMGRHGDGVPVLASVDEALSLRPEALAIGIAPVGGALPLAWRADILTALKNDITVISGLHTALARDPEFAPYAKLIRDVRYEHPEKRITTGEGMRVDALVVLFVGTDCSSGKMTAAIELTRAARARGHQAAFVATGQTGIMIGCDQGAPIDALVSDFVAGAVEKLVLDAARAEPKPDIIFVEGQGALTHPAYAGVTASLLHGAFPDVLVLADVARRRELSMEGHMKFPKNTRRFERELNEMHLRPTTGAHVAGVALVTRGLDDAEAQAARERAENELGVPAVDVFRDGADRLLDAVLEAAQARGLWSEAGFVRGAKRERKAEAGA